MKKNIIVTISFLLLYSYAHSQIITNSEAGKSSIVYPSSTANFDFGESTLGINYVHFNRNGIFSPGLIYGLSAQGSNSKGTAELISKGISAPETQFNGILGWSFAYLPEKDLRDQESVLSDTLGKINQFFYRMFKKDIEKYIDRSFDMLDSNGEDNAIKEVFKTKIVREIGGKISTQEKAVKEINNYISNNEYKKYKELLQFISDYLSDGFNTLKNARKKFENEHKKVIDQIYKSKKVAQRYTVFIEGGFGSQSFKRYSLVDTLKLSNNFRDQRFQGGNIKLGINAQIGGNWLFGASYGMARVNNFSALSGKEYTLRTTTTAQGQTLVSEKKITAYSGTYGQFDRTSFLFDVVYFAGVGDSLTIAINSYFRGNWSSDQDLYPTNLKDLGLSFNFFKANTGKFSGGIYLELIDIENKFEQLKEDPNLRAPKNRVSFGIVTKYNILSIPQYKGK